MAITENDVEASSSLRYLQPPGGTTVEAVEKPGAMLVDVETIPWTPFPMVGTYFRLLRLDEQNGGATVMFKTVAGAPTAPLHKHIGHLEIYNLTGHWGYAMGRVGPHHYMYEPAGTIHEPYNETEEFTMFGVMRGPIAGLDENGVVNSIVDGETLYQLAKENNAVAHLEHVPPLD
ncbi:MAG TPA: cupin domain-containing protein [Acidimicrobiales bacterium]|nr:cupin domain-containing protein [Acidimicrobiales bacterium]